VRRARLLLLALAAGAALALVPPDPAAAQGFNSWGGGEAAEDTPAAAFIRRHLSELMVGVPILMIAVYILLMGPSDVSEAASRARLMHRGGGWGRRGGFGGSTSLRNPWE
jgi:hypothetical protein